MANYVGTGYVAPGYIKNSQGVSRVTTDSAGGFITGILAPNVFINGKNVVCQGAAIQAHGSAPHAAATMSGHSNTVKANGIPICREGDASSCGHFATGSSNVSAG